MANYLTSAQDMITQAKIAVQQQKHTLMQQAANYQHQQAAYNAQMANSANQAQYINYPTTGAANTGVTTTHWITSGGIAGGGGLGGNGAAGIGYAVHIGPPTGAKITIAFTDANGVTVAITVDQAHAAALSQISSMNQMYFPYPPGTVINGAYNKPTKPQPMLEGDFSIDEMEAAEQIIAELTEKERGTIKAAA